MADIVSPEQFALEQIKARAARNNGGGHLSASLRREEMLKHQIALHVLVIDNLKAVLIVALEQRGSVPLLVLRKRREEILNGSYGYRVNQNADGDVLYALPEPEPGAEAEPEYKAGDIDGLTTPEKKPS